jgi:hypothetical protein
VIFIIILVVYCSILLHCVDLIFGFAFSVYVQLQMKFTLLIFIMNIRYRFCLRWIVALKHEFVLKIKRKKKHEPRLHVDGKVKLKVIFITRFKIV